MLVLMIRPSMGPQPTSGASNTSPRLSFPGAAAGLVTGLTVAGLIVVLEPWLGWPVRWTTASGALTPSPLVSSEAAVGMPAAPARDTVIGTFTVGGRTTRLQHIVGTLATDPGDEGRRFVLLLISDVPIADEDRHPDRLVALAREGRARSLRVAWLVGGDRLVVTPYHPDVARSGAPTSGGHVLDLAAFDDRSIEGSVRSRMIGQDWHYSARFEAALSPGEATSLETAEPEPVVGEEAPAAAGEDATSIKMALGRLGYEYDGEAFVRAVGEGQAEAVALFLKAGMSPDTRGAHGYPALVFAAMQCAVGDPASRVAVVKSLLDAKADVGVRDDNDSTALIWAAQSCPLEAVEALIAAGADVNARAKGGGTPLSMAEVMQRAEVADALRRAGARP
jgi:hypothetical protein